MVRTGTVNLLQMIRAKKVHMAVFALIAFLLLLKFKSFIVFFLVVGMAAVLNYFIHVTNIHVHLGHVAFLSVIFSYTLGFNFGLITVIVAHALAEILADHLDVEMMITGSIYILNCFLASVISAPIVALGLGLTFFQAVASVILGRIAGTPLHELVTEDGVEFLMLIFYYLTFANTMIGWLN
jgi:hypothetical protein